MRWDRAHHSARRLAGQAILAAGVVLAVAGIVLPFILGAAFVSYPGGPVDQSTRATGMYTLLVNPATLAPQPPQSQPMSLERHLRTVETTGDTVIVQQDDSEKIGPLPALVFSQRYAIDQGSVRNVANPQAYAYTPGNTVDRSPAYSVNLPLSTGNGPYLLWDDATGQAYRMVGGYFLGPFPGGSGNYGPPLRPTDVLLIDIVEYGASTRITAAQRAAFRADVRYWDAAIVVLGPHAPDHNQLRYVLDQLTGQPARQVPGALLWDVAAVSG